jgi:hypothetical protein
MQRGRPQPCLEMDDDGVTTRNCGCTRARLGDRAMSSGGDRTPCPRPAPGHAAAVGRSCGKHAPARATSARHQAAHQASHRNDPNDVSAPVPGRRGDAAGAPRLRTRRPAAGPPRHRRSSVPAGLGHRRWHRRARRSRWDSPVPDHASGSRPPRTGSTHPRTRGRCIAFRRQAGAGRGRCDQDDDRAATATPAAATARPADVGRAVPQDEPDRPRQAGETGGRASCPRLPWCTAAAPAATAPAAHAPRPAPRRCSSPASEGGYRGRI